MNNEIEQEYERLKKEAESQYAICPRCLRSFKLKNGKFPTHGYRWEGTKWTCHIWHGVFVEGDIELTDRIRASCPGSGTVYTEPPLGTNIDEVNRRCREEYERDKNKTKSENEE